jgi:8-oxo-dGTP pyrophosphatase MutT (NUDIX family)
MAWDDVRRFGTPLPSFPVRVRPSAYALVADGDGCIAIVRAPDGMFLPGGGVEEGESPEDGLAREAREECGWAIRIIGLRDRAVQFALAGDGSVFYEKRCEFFEIAIERETTPLEPGHETLWVPASEARALLKHEAHVWAVDRFLASRGPHLPVAVPRRIVGFHQDEERHWVADLDCGHAQHVRHDPPWQNRPWVVTAEGRARYLGVELQCKKCVEGDAAS